MPCKMPLEGRIALYDYRKERQSLPGIGPTRPGASKGLQTGGPV